LLTGCTVSGVEIVEDRCLLATAVLNSLVDCIALGCTSTPMCPRKSCASVRAAALGRIGRAAIPPAEVRGRAKDGTLAEDLEDMFGDMCVCGVLECLSLDRLGGSGVKLFAGNALLPSDLPHETIAEADIIFCNNYRGCVV
jgi:hypothetical protein